MIDVHPVTCSQALNPVAVRIRIFNLPAGKCQLAEYGAEVVLLDRGIGYRVTVVNERTTALAAPIQVIAGRLALSSPRAVRLVVT